MITHTKTSFRYFIALCSVVLGLFAFAQMVSANDAKNEKPAYYDLQVQVEKAGGQTTAVIRAVGKNGYHCNTSYPWKLKIAENDRVKVEKNIFKKGDAAKFGEDEVVFKIPYTAPKGVQVKATLKFSFCDDKQCQMKSVPVTWPASATN